MPTTTATRPTPTTSAVSRSESGQILLTQPTRVYKVSRNPFVIRAVLPAMALAFLALEVALLIDSGSVYTNAEVGGFMMIALGLLLIPAVVLQGSLTMTHDGLTFARGKQHFTAAWNEITGMTYRPDCGLCLTFKGQQQNVPNISQPGGLSAKNGFATLPMRMFGDRQFSIIYDVRDRLPEHAWKEALTKASANTTQKVLLLYAGTVLAMGVAIGLVAWNFWH